MILGPAAAGPGRQDGPARGGAPMPPVADRRLALALLLQGGFQHAPLQTPLATAGP